MTSSINKYRFIIHSFIHQQIFIGIIYVPGFMLGPGTQWTGIHPQGASSLIAETGITQMIKLMYNYMYSQQGLQRKRYMLI